MKRWRATVSFSPLNPDAVIVAQAFREIPSGHRSAALMRWASAWLQGQTNNQPVDACELTMTDEEFDALLDDF